MSALRRLNARSVQRLLVGAMPFVFLGLMVIAFYVLPSLSGRETTSFNVFNALQIGGDLGLLALALGLTMLAREFDLSVLGMYGLGAMVAIKLGGGSPVVGVIAAMATGLIAGFVQGGIIARLRMNSMTVTLGGYLILLGITGVLGNNKNVQYTNFDVVASLNRHIATVFSVRSLIAIGIFLAAFAILRWTRIGTDLRAVGGERRASRATGVRVDRYVIGVFVASGMISGLAGGLHGYSVATASPNPGLAPLVFAITATLLGGISLAGGRGSVAGIAAGALFLSFLQEFFAIQATPEYVSSVITGGLLVLVAILAAPDLLRLWKRIRPGAVSSDGRHPPPTGTPAAAAPPASGVEAGGNPAGAGGDV